MNDNKHQTHNSGFANNQIAQNIDLLLEGLVRDPLAEIQRQNADIQTLRDAGARVEDVNITLEEFNRIRDEACKHCINNINLEEFQSLDISEIEFFKSPEFTSERLLTAIKNFVQIQMPLKSIQMKVAFQILDLLLQRAMVENITPHELAISSIPDSCGQNIYHEYIRLKTQSKYVFFAADGALIVSDTLEEAESKVKAILRQEIIQDHVDYLAGRIAYLDKKINRIQSKITLFEQDAKSNQELIEKLKGNIASLEKAKRISQREFTKYTDQGYSTSSSYNAEKHKNLQHRLRSRKNPFVDFTLTEKFHHVDAYEEVGYAPEERGHYRAQLAIYQINHQSLEQIKNDDDKLKKFKEKAAAEIANRENLLQLKRIEKRLSDAQVLYSKKFNEFEKEHLKLEKLKAEITAETNKTDELEKSKATIKAQMDKIKSKKIIKDAGVYREYQVSLDAIVDVDYSNAHGSGWQEDMTYRDKREIIGLEINENVIRCTCEENLVYKEVLELDEYIKTLEEKYNSYFCLDKKNVREKVRILKELLNHVNDYIENKKSDHDSASNEQESINNVVENWKAKKYSQNMTNQEIIGKHRNPISAFFSYFHQSDTKAEEVVGKISRSNIGVHFNIQRVESENESEKTSSQLDNQAEYYIDIDVSSDSEAEETTGSGDIFSSDENNEGSPHANKKDKNPDVRMGIAGVLFTGNKNGVVAKKNKIEDKKEIKDNSTRPRSRSYGSFSNKV